MSQYYPRQSPFYPPEQNPEDDYYYDEGDYEYEEDNLEKPGDPFIQRFLIFFAGGCLVFLCMSCCGLLVAGLWILDPGSGLLTTPIPGGTIGLSFDESAFPDETVVNEQQVELSIREIARNASLPAITPAADREVIIITVRLTNLSDEEIDFEESHFTLLNSAETAYAPTPGATIVAGALGRGSLDPDEGQEGRLVFEVRAGEPRLVLAWDSRGESEPRYISLQ